jgi:outer membrane protein assembly factor BamB
MQTWTPDPGQSPQGSIKFKSGTLATVHLGWTRPLEDKHCSTIPSPVAYKGRVYLVRDRGEVECLDPASGKTIWSDTFPSNRASHYASPLIANGNLYAPREDRVVFVAGVANDQFKLLAENNMEEPVIGSPAASSDCIFIRGEKYLFCVAAGP